MSRIILGLLTIALLAGCTGQQPAAPFTPSPTPSPSPSIFNVFGDISVPIDEDVAAALPDDPTCVSKDGYDDIKDGAQVEVQDAGGTTVALGILRAGAKSDDRCVFPFTIVEVPEGGNIYGLKVGNSNRGVLKYQRAQLNTPVSLTIG